MGPLAALTQLAALDLSRCRLTKLPDAVAALPALRRLGLQNNLLTELPEGVYLACLERLYLAGNQ